MQLSLDISTAPRAGNLLEVVASGVYRQGLQRVAGMIDSSPSHLSEALSGQDRRKFGVRELERYIEQTGDTAPIIYLVHKFLRPEESETLERAAKLQDLSQRLADLLGEIKPKAKVRK